MSRLISRYRLPASQAEERFSKLEQFAVPRSLTGRQPDVDVKILTSSLKQVFLCSTQDKKILSQFLALAESHAAIHYPAASAHVKGINSKFPWGEILSPATILKGLAGTGKSELLKALNRLLGERSSIDLPGNSGIPLVAGWFMTVRYDSSLNGLLLPHIQPPVTTSNVKDEKQLKDLKIPRLLELARTVSFRDGVCLMTADEFQFVTQGSNANTKSTNLLLQLLGVGPRLIYAANYSLAHRLKARRQEDRHRLLVHPIHLAPEDFCSSDGIRLLQEFFKVIPNDFKFEANAVGQQIQDYSFGIKRLVVELLGIAWWHAKDSRGYKATVTSGDLEWAYSYKDFRVNREDVEILQRQEIEKKQIREDLWDPFFMEQQQENVSELTPAIAAFAQRVENRRFDSFLTPNERAGSEALDQLMASKPTNNSVVPIKQKRNKRSVQDLFDTFNSL